MENIKSDSEKKSQNHNKKDSEYINGLSTTKLTGLTDGGNHPPSPLMGAPEPSSISTCLEGA